MTSDAPLDPDRSRWPTIFLIVGAGVVSAFQAGKAPIALAAIQADLGLDLASASWLLSAFAIIGSLTGIAIGVGADHLGARRMAVGGLLLQAAGSAMGALSTGAPLLLATRAIEGLGFLATTIAAPALIVAVARPEDRGRAFAMWATFFPVGMTIVMLGAPLLSALGWRGFWLANAAILSAYAALFAWGTHAVPSKDTARQSVVDDIRQTLAAGAPWLLAALFAAYLTIYLAVFGFLPSILSDRLAVGPEIAGVLSAIAVAAGAVGCLACGEFLARGARSWLILASSFGAMALCGFGIFSEGVPNWTAYGLCIVFSFIGAFIPTVLIDAAPRHAPRPELTGSTMGFLMQGNSVGFVLGPAATSIIVTAAGWPAVSLFITAIVIVAVLLSLALQRREAEIEIGTKKGQ